MAFTENVKCFKFFRIIRKVPMSGENFLYNKYSLR